MMTVHFVICEFHLNFSNDVLRKPRLRYVSIGQSVMDKPRLILMGHHSVSLEVHFMIVNTVNTTINKNPRKARCGYRELEKLDVVHTLK